MAVTPITGLVNAAALVNGQDANAPDVAAELAQLITKGNETISLANTNESTISANGIALTQLAVTDATHTSQISALDARVDVLEASIGDEFLDLTEDTDLSITQYNESRYVVGYTIDMHIGLPHGTSQSHLFTYHPLTIVANIAADQLFVHITTNSPTGSWANGAEGAYSTNYLTLGPGESVTVYPLGDGAGNVKWAIIAGQESYPTP